jgi:transcription elongation factor SPT6
VEDQELNPIAFAEQFTNPGAAAPQTPEEVLRRARMILATELGKDPLLRQAMRDLFRTEAQISVQPTDRGVNKIDEHHPYFVSLLKPTSSILLTHRYISRTSSIFIISLLLKC